MMPGPGETVVTVVESNGQSPATSAVLGALGNLGTLLSAIRATLERREKLSPGAFAIWPNKLAISTRYRVESLVISPNGTAVRTLQIRVGSATRLTVECDRTTVIPLPITLDRGVEVEVWDAATGAVALPAVLHDAFITAYTE